MKTSQKKMSVVKQASMLLTESSTTNGFPVFKLIVRMAGLLTGGNTSTIGMMALQG